MSLIPFHRGLITVAIFFCFGYGAWEIVGFGRTGAIGSLTIGTVFLALGVGLVLYLRRLNRFLGYDARE
ncbi:MAG: hypothetical protein WEG36_02510 [Gemmatimonadota bacterium]|jgi:hypothetical protein